MKFDTPALEARSLQGWTLMEILICVGIVTVLVTLLFGGLRKVQSFAYSARCLQNLKAIHSAAMSYGADNDGRLPDAVFWCSTGNTGDNGQTLAEADNYRLLPYLDLRASAATSQSTSASKPAPVRTILSCMAIQKSPYPSTWDFSAGYGLNSYASGSHYQKSASGDPTQDVRRKIFRFESPSRTMLFSCASLADIYVRTPCRARYSTVTSYGVAKELPDPLPNSVNRFTYPHGEFGKGSINAAFIDGHVEAVSRDRIVNTLNDPTSNTEASLFWFGNPNGVILK